MASQRITIVKLGGMGAEIALQRLGEWATARQSNDPNVWSPDQWPEHVRKKADEFCEHLRIHGFELPVIHFVEWADMWSMGDLFVHWLTPPSCPRPICVHANRFEVFGYSLPDGGRLAEFLANAGPQQWTESDWFIVRLREAVEAWQKRVERAAILVLRYVVAASALDEEVTASLQIRPDWLS